jgi:hypothetical protein
MTVAQAMERHHGNSPAAAEAGALIVHAAWCVDALYYLLDLDGMWHYRMYPVRTISEAAAAA